MVSDDERREVASNIMENYVCGGLGYKVASAYNIAMAIGMNPGLLVGDIELWERLADLIEPPYPDATASYKGWRVEVYDPDGVLASPSNVAADLVRAHADGKALSEPKVKCVAEVKVDGERLEKLAHDAAVELTGIDRDALLALADEMEADGTDCYTVSTQYVLDDYARRIREALGVTGG